MDGSLGGAKGPVTPVSLPNGKKDIPIAEPLGKRVGQNLFHSFSSFDIVGGDSATFTGSNGIRNVVSRVTGGNYSTIDGTLRSTIQGANLYFLNPWGVVFGPNASLDVKGSFHVSTADYLRFEDGAKFYSTPNGPGEVLSAAPPAAFGFLSPTPAPVHAVNSFLQVPDGETLSIVGGDIGLSGAYLWAPGGRINLASMASPGEVVPSHAGQRPDIRVQPQKASGTIEINGSTLDAGGAPSGTVLIRSGRLVLDQDAWITAGNYGDTTGSNPAIGIVAGNMTLENRSWITAAVFGGGKGGNIEIDAQKLTLLNESLIGALPWWGSTGDGGDVRIATAILEIGGASSISSDTRGFARGGLIRADATESIRLTDTLSALSSASWASGDAGTIVLNTPHLLIENEAAVYGDTFGEGRGGDISIFTGKLNLLSGGTISSNSFGPTGNGGDLFLSATGSISISGTGPNGLKSSLENRTSGRGNAGQIQVATPVLEIGEDGSISAETLGTGQAGDIDIIVETVGLSAGGRISTSAFGTTGQGGDVYISAIDSITLSGRDSQGIPSGLFSYARDKGDAGSIFLSAPNMTLTGGASIGADTFGDGRAGNIALDTHRLCLEGGATITSGSIGASGRGGNIHVAASEDISLSGLFSAISTSTDGAGRGGDIRVLSLTLTLQNQSAIYADTLGSGLGGGIQMEIGSLSVNGGSRISSSTYDRTGDGGHVTIQADKDMSFTGTFSGVYSVSSGDGKGGDIQLKAAEIGLTDGAQISASSKGAGDAGNIDITATGSLISRNSKVSTSSRNADGGNITITVPYMVHLIDSEITASVGGGASTVGGNISIDPQFVILDHSRIIANAYEGQGGNIRIVANVFLADPYSVVDASSALGIDGIVDIRAPITEISGTLVPLGEDFISALELLREPCMARIRGGKYSSFIVSGRDGLPMEPGGLLPSPMP
jgi:filamentous hemagglutinin family protein